MVGKVFHIENHGTIVIVWIKNEEGRHPIYFDHRPFANLSEAEDGNIIGREVEYDTSGEENILKFLD